jgi:hypothetical protein
MDKYCIHCGNSLYNGADFCIHCGKNINAQTVNQIRSSQPQTYKQNTSKFKKNKIIIGIISIIVVIIVFLVVFFLFFHCTDELTEVELIGSWVNQENKDTWRFDEHGQIHIKWADDDTYETLLGYWDLEDDKVLSMKTLQYWIGYDYEYCKLTGILRLKYEGENKIVYEFKKK